jgi:hypothetical protein
MNKSTIRFSNFPRTEPPPSFVEDVVAVFRQHEGAIATETNYEGLKSKSEYGLNMSKRNDSLLEPYRFDHTVQI